MYVPNTSNCEVLKRTKKVKGSSPVAGVGPQITGACAWHQFLWGRRGSVSFANLLCAGVGVLHWQTSSWISQLAGGARSGQRYQVGKASVLVPEGTQECEVPVR